MRMNLVPTPGQIAKVRQRRYLVEEVVSPPRGGDSTLVRLSCVDDACRGSNVQYEQSQTAFASGDRLVLIMDGITEAMNDQNEEFGEDRLIDLLLQYRHMGAAELQKTVIDTVASFARQALQDDATLMIIAMH